MRGAQIVIEQHDATAISAALVASWIAGELTAFPDVALTLHERRIVIDVGAVASSERPRLVAALSDALEEPRFDGWLAQPG